MDDTPSSEGTAVAILYIGTAAVLVLAFLIGRSKSAAVKSARVRLPVLFFGIFTLIAASYGIYNLFVCFRDIFARNLAAWNEFLDAEIVLLIAWRLLMITAVALAILRGRISSEQATVKRGTAGRFLFMAATATACFVYLVAKGVFGMPLLFVHLGHAIIAVLIFCTFTYPWRKSVPMTPERLSEPN